MIARDRAFTRTASALGVIAALTIPGTALASDNARFPEKPWGYESPAGRCTVCHSLKPDRRLPVAPTLWGIMGAEKARARHWFTYSGALLKKGGTWTADEMDKYLANPRSFLPGTKKSIHVADEQERKEIIGYLEKLK